MPILVPPKQEQASIVQFLDYADRRIRRYVRAKQRLIKLLDEQRAVMVQDAVTRGLDRSAKLKSSGVQWLREVPGHWEVVQFKRRVGFQEGPGIMADDFRDEGVPLLRISCLRGDEATLEGCNYLDSKMVERRWKHFAVNAGDYLLSASGSTGAVALATEVVAGAISYTGIIRLWPVSEKTFMPYMRLFMGCRPFQDQIDAAKSGVGIEHFGPTHLKRMAVSLPPYDEQRRIVEWVTRETAPTAALIAAARREIDLVREYRTRLIADVVTGKVDVRGAAASLPDDTDAYDFPEVEVEAEGSVADIDREAIDAELSRVEA
jgi:type I restriction enzyme S subunit